MEQHPAAKEKGEVPPPPPPPSPPPPKLQGTAREPSIALDSFPCNLVRHAFDYKHHKNFIAFCRSVEPVLQDGPCCGIVALAMASQLLNEKHFAADEILTAAKRLNFTKNGEIFSAENMASLASTVLDCNAKVVAGLSEHKRELLNAICRDCPVLIPYDADRNHHPCLNEGRNAHWALLNGVCCAVSDEHSICGYERDCDEIRISSVSSGSSVEHVLDSSARTCVFAHQGKSKHVALWDLETLLSSNKNMFEVTKKYEAEDLLLPNSCDALCELRDKAVVLERKTVM